MDAAVQADIDLDERCSIKWVHLPYPVENVTGRLSIHPDKWIIRNMRGINGQAVITASGLVEADAHGHIARLASKVVVDPGADVDTAALALLLAA